MRITARVISPLGLGRQRQRTARHKGSARPKREVWARKSVYQLLLFIFRPRPGKQPVTPPFLKNRPLTEAEFQGAQELYVLQRRRRRDRFADPIVGDPVTADTTGDSVQHDELQHDVRERKKARDLSKVFQFFDQSAKSGDWKAHEFIGKAMFASKQERQRLRKQAIKEKTFISGPLERRKFLAAAWRALPQAKNRFSPLEVTRIAAFRRGREFLWALLVGEARALARDQGSFTTAGAPAQADTLAQHYPYLGLTADQIRAGLEHLDKQADLDTAAEFQISPSYVRRLL